MNMFATIAVPTHHAKVMACNAWVDEARPIIVAMFALEDAQGDLFTAQMNARGNRRYNEPTQPGERTFMEARDYVETARTNLFEMLDGIRDNYLCDERQSCLVEMMPQQAEAVDEFNDWLDDEVISVKAAVDLVIAEQNARVFA